MSYECGSGAIDKRGYRILVGRPLGKCLNVRLRKDGWIILRQILARKVMSMVGSWTDSGSCPMEAIIALVGLTFRVPIILLVNKFQIKDKNYSFVGSEYTYLRHPSESDCR